MRPSLLRWLRRSLWLALAISLGLRATSLASPARGRSRAEVNQPATEAVLEAANQASDESLDDAPAAGSRTRVIGPSIASVLSAAYATAGLDHAPGAGWTWRSRLAGLLPWLTVRTTRDTSWQDEHAEVGRGTTLELRATWRLDRIVFDGHELQVATIDAARRRERRRLASRVIRSYFAWRRAGGSAAADDERSIARSAERAAESAAELDALTDGWFSREVARMQAGPDDTNDSHGARGDAAAARRTAP